MFKKKVGMDNNSDLDKEIQNQLGVPPVPPMPPMGAPSMSAADAMAAELSNAAPEPIVGPAKNDGDDDKKSDDAAATLDALMADAPKPSMGGADMSKIDTLSEGATMMSTSTPEELMAVKKNMLKDLFPLMDKVTMTAEQRFKVYREMIEDTGDKSYIAGAYEAVKEIEDQTVKAEALLFLVEQADK